MKMPLTSSSSSPTTKVTNKDDQAIHSELSISKRALKLVLLFIASLLVFFNVVSDSLWTTEFMPEVTDSKNSSARGLGLANFSTADSAPTFQSTLGRIGSWIEKGKTATSDTFDRIMATSSSDSDADGNSVQFHSARHMRRQQHALQAIQLMNKRGAFESAVTTWNRTLERGFQRKWGPCTLERIFQRKEQEARWQSFGTSYGGCCRRFCFLSSCPG